MTLLTIEDNRIDPQVSYSLEEGNHLFLGRQASSPSFYKTYPGEIVASSGRGNISSNSPPTLLLISKIHISPTEEPKDGVVSSLTLPMKKRHPLSQS